MMHLFINSVAATAGGGLTYTRNVIPHLAARPGVRLTVALDPSLRRKFGQLDSVEFIAFDLPSARRFWREQLTLPGLIRRCGAHVLLSTGNFALRKSPVPQILLSRNSIYTSAEFSRDLCSRREYRAWLDTRLRAILAKRSIHWADITVAPSEAFAAELSRWAGARVIAIHHGFDHEAFTRDPSPLAPEIEARLREVGSSLKLLFVSHYNYYRNFETLIRALPFLRNRLPGRAVKLLLTCELTAGRNPGAYRPEAAADLVKKLGVSDMVVEFGTIPYGKLHRLYACADVYVSPAYTETFSHPLVEAMASGLPVAASDLAVHREICGDAAAYFQRFDPEGLADCVAQIAESQERRKSMTVLGLRRSRDFSWKVHVEQILTLSRSLLDTRSAKGIELARTV